MHTHPLRSCGLAIIFFLTFDAATAQGIFVDTRDNSTYVTVEIGGQLWLKENLKFKTPTSWCAEHPESEACAYGNYYYPTDLINVCPDDWRVATWHDYKKALKNIAEYYDLTDSVKYEQSTLPLYRDLKLEGEMLTGLTLIGDSTFFDMATTGWIEGDEWHPQNETTMWIVHDISNTPQPHVHIRDGEVTMHSHGHNVIDKPKKLRRFSVRCVSEQD
jgi:uncharacterized protein (TIGR02145 family)